MDNDMFEKHNSIKLVISEAVMVLAVIVTVVVLAFIVSGYWMNSNFELERQGMLQIYSSPTGANVLIDGESSWMQRTNTSKVLSSGEHTVTLSKSGYDTWSKTIDIKEGLLYRIHYPRLFLLERTSEKMLDVTNMEYATISSDRSVMIIANNTSEWILVNLAEQKNYTKKINISDYFSGVSLVDEAKIGLFNGQILASDWSRDNNHVIFKVKVEDRIEWVIIDINNIADSINLTKQFGVDFSSVKILNDSASSLLVVQNGNLHRLDVNNRQISAILVENVESFDYRDNELFFVAKNKKEDDTVSYYLGSTSINNVKIVKWSTLSEPARVIISKFYEDQLLILLQQDRISLYTKDDFELQQEYNLSFNPSHIKVGSDGAFIVMSSGASVATLDMESETMTEWSVDGSKIDWLDDSMIYSIDAGELIVYDFDGLNRRVLAKNVSTRFPVTITNEKWLYYFSDEQLMREWLIPR